MAELDDSVRALFAAPNLIHVATVAPERRAALRPGLVPAGGRPDRFFTQPGSRKARNLARDPRVAISAVSHANPYRMVQVRGRVAETLDGDGGAGGHRPARPTTTRAAVPDALRHRLPRRAPSGSSTMDLPFERAGRARPTGPRASVTAVPAAETTDRVDALLEGLNEPQREAVTAGDGPLLILAGAGSGKTRVLTHRIALPAAHAAGARGRDPRDHVHQQGRAGDARARRAARRPRDPRDVGHDLPLRLRADAARRRPPARLHAPVHDLRLGRPAAADQEVPRRPRHRPEALHPARDAGPDLRREEQAPLRRRLPPLVGSFFEQTVADVYEAYERELHRANAMDFDDLLFRAVDLLALFQEVRDRYAKAFRYILVDEYQDTNHAQYRWLQLLASEHRNLAVVGDDAQSIYGFRGADITNILNFEDDYVDAHVVKLEQNYRSTQTDPVGGERGDREQPRAEGQAPVDGPRRGRPDQGPRAARRARRGALRRRGDRAARRRGRLPRRDRGLLPDERAVPRARGHARPRADRLPGHRRHEVLRAGGGQGRDRVPDVPRQPGRRRRVHADRQLAQARHRADVALARARARGDDGHHAVGGGRGRRVRCRPSASRRVKALGRFMSTMERLRERAEATRRSPSCSRRLLRETGYLDALEAERTIEAQGRIENLQELVGVAREYDAQPGGGEERTVETFLQQIALLADADGLARRRGPRDADDAPQREGPRVPDRVHHRLRGRPVPARPRARRGRPGGGAAARLRRHHPRDARPLPDLRAPAQHLRRQSYGIRSRFVDEIPRELTDQPDRNAVGAGRPAGAGRVASWATAAAASRRAEQLGRLGPGSAAAAVATTARARCSASATTSSTPRSATASSPASSPAGSSS